MVCDSGYPEVCRDYCRDVAGWFRSDLRRLHLLGDWGREMTVVTAIACQSTEGVTLARIAAAAERLDFASVRRVRAICGQLERLGAAHPMGPGGDRRQRPLRFGGAWLEQALLEWLRLAMRALERWLEPLPDCDLSAVGRLCRFTVSALEQGKDHPVPAWPAYRQVRDHVAGWPVLAELVGAAPADAAAPAAFAVSRKGLALAHGVSRIHIASLLALFEELGWLVRPDAGARLAFAPQSLSRLRVQLARELAWVGLAFADDGHGLG
jgi:hypothetical protein